VHARTSIDTGLQLLKPKCVHCSGILTPELCPASSPMLTQCSEAQLCRGYSPLLWLTVPDLNGTGVAALRMGATLDGSMQHQPTGKVSRMGRG